MLVRFLVAIPILLLIIFNAALIERTLAKAIQPRICFTMLLGQFTLYVLGYWIITGEILWN